jgi:hypothetical protein
MRARTHLHVYREGQIAGRELVDADIVPEPRVATAPPDPMADLWANPRWGEIALAFQAVATDEDPEPSQVHVPEKLGIREETLRQRLRRLEIPDWRDVPSSSPTTQAGTSGRVFR